MLRDLYPELFSPFLQSDGGGGGDGSGDGGGDDGDTKDKSKADGDKDDKNEKDSSKDTASKDALPELTAEQQAKFDAIIEDRVKRAATKAAKEAATAERTRIETEAKNKKDQEEGNFKGLYETAASRVAELEADIKQRERTDMARTAAETHKLPARLIDRLKGETQDELNEDAKALAKELGAREAPDTDGGRGAPGSTKPIRENGTQEDASKVTKSEPLVMSDGRKKVAWTDGAT